MLAAGATRQGYLAASLSVCVSHLPFSWPPTMRYHFLPLTGHTIHPFDSTFLLPHLSVLPLLCIASPQAVLAVVWIVLNREFVFGGFRAKLEITPPPGSYR